MSPLASAPGWNITTWLWACFGDMEAGSREREQYYNSHLFPFLSLLLILTMIKWYNDLLLFQGPILKKIISNIISVFFCGFSLILEIDLIPLYYKCCRAYIILKPTLASTWRAVGYSLKFACCCAVWRRCFSYDNLMVRSICKQFWHTVVLFISICNKPNYASA